MPGRAPGTVWSSVGPGEQNLGQAPLFTAQFSARAMAGARRPNGSGTSFQTCGIDRPACREPEKGACRTPLLSIHRSPNARIANIEHFVTVACLQSFDRCQVIITMIYHNAVSTEDALKHFLSAILLGSTFIACSALAQETTYTFISPAYAAGSSPINCTVGDCTTYSIGQRARIALTLSAPLAPNLPKADRRASVISYSFDDGVRPTSSPNANAALAEFNIATDSAGMPLEYEIEVQRVAGPPYLINVANDPNSRVSSVIANDFSMSAQSNYICNQRGGTFSQPRYCLVGTTDSGYSNVSSGVPTVTVGPAYVPPAATAVPTLSEWAMILFGTVLAGSAAVVLQQRQIVA